MNKTAELDSKFQELFTNMVEIAFEYVDRNSAEVDNIYIFGSMEEDAYYYDVLYMINNRVVYTNEINDVSTHQYNISDARLDKLFDLGKSYLAATSELFKEHNKEVPTILKMCYSPKTGQFNNDIIYEPQYSNDDERIVSDSFDEWYEELLNEL